ncbi:hypothetical protein KI387_025296, partial [Taxus chinensis]
KTDDPQAQILYEDRGHGNYMILSPDEIQPSKVSPEDPNGVWILEFDGSCSSAGSGA